MRVAIIGSRNCGNFRIQAIFDHLPAQCSRIISGGARGIDAYARQTARELGIPFDCVDPEYEKYGKNAPLLRNEVIVDRADMVLAFWDFQSRGTADAIVKCIEKKVPVRVIGLDECRGPEVCSGEL